MKKGSQQYNNAASKQIPRNAMTEAWYKKTAKAVNRRIRALEESNKTIERMQKKAGVKVGSDSTFLTEYKFAQQKLDETLSSKRKSGEKAKAHRFPERIKTMTDREFSEFAKALQKVANLDLSKKHATMVYQASKESVSRDMVSKLGDEKDVQDIVDMAIVNNNEWQEIRNALGSERASQLYSELKNSPNNEGVTLHSLYEGIAAAKAAGILPYDHAGLYQYTKTWIRVNYAASTSPFYSYETTGTSGTKF